MQVLPVKPILPDLTEVPIVSRLQNRSTGIVSTSPPDVPSTAQPPGRPCFPDAMRLAQSASSVGEEHPKVAVCRTWLKRRRRGGPLPLSAVTQISAGNRQYEARRTGHDDESAKRHSFLIKRISGLVPFNFLSALQPDSGSGWRR